VPGTVVQSTANVARGRAVAERSLPQRGTVTVVIFVALLVWALIPVAFLLVRGAIHHESLSGGEGLAAADQLQYLAWIRSLGEHGLAADGFDLHAGNHVFLHPMFVISAALWRAGVNIAVSYLLWLPVAVAALFIGARRFVVATLESPPARTAALVLAIFFVTPLAPLSGWTVGSNGLGVLGGELAPTGAMFGYFPTPVAVGLLALFVVVLLDMVEGSPSARRIAGAAAAGLVTAWIHPWQGATALIILAGLFIVVRPARRQAAMWLIPAAATAAPLGYYAVLARADAGWRIAHVQNASNRPNILLLMVALAPLLVPAIASIRRGRPRGRELRTVALWLWPAAALAVYFGSPEFAPHALEGLSLPLAVLAVRAWRRHRWPRWSAALGILLATVPGLVFDLQLMHDAAVADPQGLLLRHDETRALAYLEATRGPGGVLPSLRLSAAVPAYTGRRAWLGHAVWTPDFAGRAQAVAAFFGGHLTPAQDQAFVRAVGARYLLDDCEPAFSPRRLGGLRLAERRFGCVEVIELAVRDTSKPL
jgi:hypothetical protein